MAIVTRESQKPDVLYVMEDDGSCFVSLDGEGRYYYDSEEEAEEDYGFDFTETVYVTDWEE